MGKLTINMVMFNSKLWQITRGYYLIRSCIQIIIHFTKHGATTIVAVRFQLLLVDFPVFFYDFCIGINGSPGNPPTFGRFFRCILGRIMVGKRIMAADVSRGHPGRAAEPQGQMLQLPAMDRDAASGEVFFCRKLRFHTCRCWSYLILSNHVYPIIPRLGARYPFFYQNMPSRHFKKIMFGSQNIAARSFSITTIDRKKKHGHPNSHDRPKGWLRDTLW